MSENDIPQDLHDADEITRQGAEAARRVFSDYPHTAFAPSSEGGNLQGENDVMFDPSKRIEEGDQGARNFRRYLADTAKTQHEMSGHISDLHEAHTELRETHKLQRHLDARRIVRLSKEVQIDLQTSAKSKNAFHGEFPAAVERASREGKLLGIFFGDVDGLKLTNDTMGHDKGDELLAIVVEEIRKHIRESDDIFRVGGDEFVVILEDFKAPDDIAPDKFISMRAQDIQEAVINTMRKEGFAVDEGAGFSIAGGLLTPGESWKALYDRVDKEMYMRKKHRKSLFGKPPPR